MPERQGDMAQEWAKAFYKSKKWIKCRNYYISCRIKADGGLCEECHNKPGYIVHHRIMLTPDNITDPDVSMNSQHLEYVCKDCHDKFEGHGVNRSEKPLCIFDAEGQPVSIREVDRKPRSPP